MTIANELLSGVVVGPVPLALVAYCVFAHLRRILAKQKHSAKQKQIDILILSIFGISPFIVAFTVYCYGFQRSELSVALVAWASAATAALNMLVIHLCVRRGIFEARFKKIPTDAILKGFLGSFAVIGAFSVFFVNFPQALTGSHVLSCQRQICDVVEFLVGSRSYIFGDLWLFVWTLGSVATCLAFSLYIYFVKNFVALR
jgi:hypothetical protein